MGEVKKLLKTTKNSTSHDWQWIIWVNWAICDLNLLLWWMKCEVLHTLQLNINNNSTVKMESIKNFSPHFLLRKIKWQFLSLLSTFETSVSERNVMNKSQLWSFSRDNKVKSLLLSHLLVCECRSKKEKCQLCRMSSASIFVNWVGIVENLVFSSLKYLNLLRIPLGLMNYHIKTHNSIRCHIWISK